MSTPEIAKSLGVTYNVFLKWRRTKPTLKFALKEGKQAWEGNHNANESIKDWVFQQLPPHLQKKWNEIEECYNSPNGMMRIDAMFRGNGDEVRKHLYLHALTVGNVFDPNKAMRKLGITKNKLDEWVRSDPRFAELIDNAKWHLKNFYEAALVRKVKQGSLPAIMMANKTINRDRGYGDKMEVEHFGTIQHNHQHRISIDELPLDNRTRRGILRAMEKAGVDDFGVIDATKSEVKAITHVKE